MYIGNISLVNTDTTTIGHFRDCGVEHMFHAYDTIAR